MLQLLSNHAFENSICLLARTMSCIDRLHRIVEHFSRDVLKFTFTFCHGVALRQAYQMETAYDSPNWDSVKFFGDGIDHIERALIDRVCVLFGKLLNHIRPKKLS